MLLTACTYYVLFGVTPALADPFVITPLIATLLAATIGNPVIVGSITLATVISSIVTVALGVGAALLFRPRLPKQASAGSVPVQQPIPYRIFAYGETRVAGAYVFKETVLGSGLLTMVVALTGHLVDSFIGLYLNDDLVTIPRTSDLPGGMVSGYVGVGIDSRYASNTCLVDSRVGLATETAYSQPMTDYPTLYPATARGDGCASLYVRCNQNAQTTFAETWPFGPPAPSVILRAAQVFDPRDDTQSESDPSTWKWSKNVALLIIHHQCHNPYGPQRSYSVAIAPVLSDWIEAANDCDDLIPLRWGGTERRYEASGWATTEIDRRTVLQQLIAACDGWFNERGDGTILLRAGKYYAPTIVLTDDNIAGFTIQTDLPDIDKVNEISGEWTNPDANFAIYQTAPIINSADQASRGGAPRRARVQLDWTDKNGQASRLVKREFIRSKAPVRGRLDLRLSGINAAYERLILLQSNSIPLLSNQVIENRKPILSLLKGLASIEFIAVGSEIDDWDPAVDESPMPYVAGRDSAVGQPRPINLVVVPEFNGSTTVLDISFDLPWLGSTAGVAYDEFWETLTYVVSWRLHDTGSGPGSWTTQNIAPMDQTFTPWGSTAEGRVSMTTDAVTNNALLDVMVSVGSGHLDTGTLRRLVDCSAPAPGIPTLSATGHSGSASLSTTNPTSPILANMRFWRVMTGGRFQDATPIALVAAASGGTTTFDDDYQTGTYDYFAQSISAAGVASAFSGPVTATIA